MTAHRYIEVAGLDVFYREAGDPDRPSVLPLHGFPSSSHMFRRMISRLSNGFLRRHAAGVLQNTIAT